MMISVWSNSWQKNPYMLWNSCPHLSTFQNLWSNSMLTGEFWKLKPTHLETAHTGLHIWRLHTLRKTVTEVLWHIWGYAGSHVTYRHCRMQCHLFEIVCCRRKFICQTSCPLNLSTTINHHFFLWCQVLFIRYSSRQGNSYSECSISKQGGGGGGGLKILSFNL